MIRLAALSALLAACVPEPSFHGIGTGPDAIPDAPVGSVTVRTYSRDLLQNLQQDVHVYFADRDGTVRTEATTGGSAEVTGEIEAGGTLFVRYPQLIVIVADVKLGQTYEFGAAQTMFATRLAVTASVARVAAAPNYTLLAPCGSGSVSDASTSNPVPVAFTWRDGCGSATSVGVMSYHASLAGVVASTRYQLIGNGAGGANFVMSSVPSAPVSITANVTGNGDLMMVTPSVSAVEGTTRYSGTVFPAIPAGQSMSTGAYFKASATAELSTQYTLVAMAPELGPQVLLERVATAASLTRDVSSASRAPFVSRPIPDEDPRTFRWTQTDGAAQFVALDFSITRGADPVRNVRYFFPPPEQPSATLPTMPEALADFAPVADDVIAPILSMTRMDGAEFADIAAMYDVNVRAAEGLPTRLLDASNFTTATISKSP